MLAMLVLICRTAKITGVLPKMHNRKMMVGRDMVLIRLLAAVILEDYNLPRDQSVWKFYRPIDQPLLTSKWVCLEMHGNAAYQLQQYSRFKKRETDDVDHWVLGYTIFRQSPFRLCIVRRCRIGPWVSLRVLGRASSQGTVISKMYAMFLMFYCLPSGKQT